MPNKPQDIGPAPIGNSFVTTLNELRKGLVINEASEKLAELVAAVRDTGKAGSLTIKLTLKPMDSAADTLTVSDSIKVTLPEVAKSATIFYPTDENTLSRQDPNQKTLDLREVPREEPAAKQAKAV